MDITDEEIQQSVLLLKAGHVFGTGFIVHTAAERTFVVTCAHVVHDAADTGKPLLARGKEATVLNASPRGSQPDLAVLTVPFQPGDVALDLSPDDAASEVPFVCLGNQESSLGAVVAEPLYQLSPIDGKIIRLTYLDPGDGSPRTPAYKLGVLKDGTWADAFVEIGIQPGFSGSPVVHRPSRSVLAVVSHQLAAGSAGYGVSVKALTRIWPEAVQLLRPSAPRQDNELQALRSRIAELEGKLQRSTVPGALDVAKLADMKDKASQLELAPASAAPVADIAHLFPKIDFRDAVSLLCELASSPDAKEHVRLFLADDADAKGAEFCLLRIGQSLRDDTARPVVRLDVGFSATDLVDVGTIIDSLSLRYGLPPSLDPAAQTDQVVSTICDSLEPGSVVLFAVGPWELARPPDDVMEWFVSKFWLSLKSRIEEGQDLRLYGILYFNDPLPAEERPASEECSSLCALPLTNCTRKDIFDWLTDHRHKTPAEARSLSERLFKLSGEGVVRRLYKLLVHP